MKTLRKGLLFAALLVAAPPLAAQPAQVPVQGNLTNASGAAIDGALPITFRLYNVATGGAPIHVETLPAVQVDEGRFTAWLGSAVPLDLGIFSGAVVYVGISVAGGTEMTPRLPVGTTPYAAYAGRAGTVPWAGVTGIPADIADGDANTTYSATSPLTLNPGTGVFGLGSGDCDPGETWIWSGSTWACSNATPIAYTQGPGIQIDSNTISSRADACGANQYSRWDGSLLRWVCANDQVGISSLLAGLGTTPVGNRVDINSPNCAALGQYSQWTGSAWTCVPDQTSVTTYTASRGVQLVGSDFRTAAQTCVTGQHAFWDGTVWTCTADEGIRSVTGTNGITATTAGNAVSLVTTARTCLANEYSFWDGDSWECRADSTGIASLTQGNGIAVDGTTISIRANACDAPNFSRWTGTAWACEADRGITTISPTTATNGILVTGSGTSRTIATVAVTCGVNQYSYWDGDSWECRTDLNSGGTVTSVGPSTATNGIRVTNSGGAYTVATSAITCSGTQYSWWDGDSWECRTDNAGITAVAESTGIDVSTSSGTATVSIEQAILNRDVPIGTIVAWTNHISGTPALPTGWVRCDGSTISVSGSPLNGQATPNLNGTFTTEAGVTSSYGRFLRGHSLSGAFEQDRGNTLDGVRVLDDGRPNAHERTGFPLGGAWSASVHEYYTTGSNDSQQFKMRGVENRPGSMTVVWIMRVL